MHYVTLRSQGNEEHKFGLTCSDALIVESVPIPPKHEKLSVNVSQLGRTEMHYMTRRCHMMQNTSLE
jgi:hypothetical protein